MSVNKKINLLLDVQREASRICDALEAVPPPYRVDCSFLRSSLLKYQQFAVQEVPSLPGEVVK